MTLGGIVLLTIGGYNGITVGTVETADLFGDSEECTLQQTPLPFANEFRYSRDRKDNISCTMVTTLFIVWQ